MVVNSSLLGRPKTGPSNKLHTNNTLLLVQDVLLKQLGLHGLSVGHHSLHKSALNSALLPDDLLLAVGVFLVGAALLKPLSHVLIAHDALHVLRGLLHPQIA